MLVRRKSSEPIEVHQFFLDTIKAPLDGVFVDAVGPFVTTIHGQRAYLKEGDWVFPEPDGIHYYPVADSVFKERYEELQSTELRPGVVLPYEHSEDQP